MANRATRALHDPWGVVRRRITPGRPADPAQPAAAAPSPEPGPSPKPAPKPKAKPKAKARPRVIGLVEQFSRRAVVGWVSVPVGAPPVRVDLRLGKVTAASTWATAVVKSAEPDDTDDPDLDDDVPAEAVAMSLSAPDQDEAAPSWQLPNLPGPGGELPVEGGRGGVVALLEGGQALLDLVEVGEVVR